MSPFPIMRPFLISVFFLFAAFQASAYHIAGGELTVQHLSGNIFRLKLTLFRDCTNPQGSPFDDTITVGVFRRNDDTPVDSFHVGFTSGFPLELTGAACVAPPAVCLEQGEYIRNITLPDQPGGYYLVWERCCRNASVANLDDPISTGMAFYCEVPDPALHNSTPQFNTPPAPFLCEEQFFRLNFTASDADGDSLVYVLTPPLNGGHTSNTNANPFSPSGNNQFPEPGPYSDAMWAYPYDIANICGGTPPLSINSQSGLIEGYAYNAGIYALAVTVFEYRNGVLLGQVRREFEFTVIICTGNTIPQITVSNSNSYDFEIYASDTLCFNVSVTDPDGDSLVMIHYGELYQNDTASSITAPYATSADSTGGDTLQVQFCWYTSCTQNRDSVYKVYYEATDNGCPIPALVKTILRIKVNPAPLPDPPNLLCMLFPDSNTVELKCALDTVPPEQYFVNYTMYRSMDGAPFTSYKTMIDYRNPDLTDHDAGNREQHNYCYAITATNRCGVETGLSDTLCTATSFNDKKNYITAVSVVSPDNISISWEPFADAEYSVLHLYRSENDSSIASSQITQFASSRITSTVDAGVETSEKSYCYTLMNTDFCGNNSPVSESACSILLKGVSHPFIHNLDWNAYLNWRNNVDHYNVEKSDVINAVPFNSIGAVNELIFSDKDFDYSGGVFRYRIRAHEAGTNAESLSNEVEINQSPIMWAPNAFSPNNDGKNDKWNAQLSFVKTYSLSIYDRWGQLLWQTTSQDDQWDGLYNGKAVPQDVYWYRITFSGYDSNDIFEKTGRLTVLR